MRTLCSFNHTGLMKSRSRSCYEKQPLVAAMGYDPTIGGPAWAATQAGPFLAERHHGNDSRLYKDGLSADCMSLSLRRRLIDAVARVARMGRVEPQRKEDES
jgi:hypothetical protein